MDTEDKQIVPFEKFTNGVKFEQPSVPDGARLEERTLTQIVNAIDAQAYLDDQGRLWLEKQCLSKVVRTSKGNANYIFDKITNKHKVSYNDKEFVRSNKILGQISEEIEKSGLEKRGHYLRFSEECLKRIRDSDTAKALRGEYEAYLKSEKKKLKKRRIKEHKITLDELTGEKLEVRSAEFSHIRSSSMFKDSSLNIENGLIVNKETHEIITAADINDEDELIALCSMNNWDESWYEVFKRNFP